MSKITNIIEGWTNYAIGGDQTTMDEAKRRAKICARCPAASKGLHTALLPDFTFGEIQGMYCDEKKGGCGCPLSPAVRSKNHKCPKNLW